MADSRLVITIDTKGNVEGLKKTEKALDGVTNSAKKSHSGFSNIRSQFGDFNSGLGQITGTLGNMAKGFWDLGVTMAKWGAVGASAVGGIASAITVLGVKSTADMQMLRTSFDTMLGSAEKGSKMFEDLAKMAKTTPFETSDLAEAGKTLLAFGINSEKVLPTLKTLGDISLGNKEKMKSLALVFGQIQSSGRLMGQDLLQLINLGFNPLQKISERTGESMESLKKKMEKGQISASMVTQEFERATQKGGQFYQGMEKGSQTLLGLASTLKDDVMVELRGFIGMAENGDIRVGSLYDRVQKFIPVLSSLTKGFAFFVKEGDFANDFMADFFKWAGMSRKQVVSLSTTMENLRTKLIETATSGWGYLQEKGRELQERVLIPMWTFIQQTMIPMWERWWPTIKSVGEALWDIATRVGEAIMKTLNNNKDTIDKYTESFRRLIDKLVEFWNTNKNWIIPTLETFMGVLIKVGGALGTFAMNYLSSAIDQLQKFIDNIIDAYNWLMRLLGKDQLMKNMASSKVGGAGAQGALSKAGLGAAGGADFIVPPGYPNDSYPLRVQSGEHVKVTPAGQISSDNRTFNINNNFSSNTNADTVSSRIAFQLRTA